MSGTTYLATLDEPASSAVTSECLVVFLADGHDPEPCLADPAVISLRPATGHWCLVYFEAAGGRAYYSRFERPVHRVPAVS